MTRTKPKHDHDTTAPHTQPTLTDNGYINLPDQQAREVIESNTVLDDNDDAVLIQDRTGVVLTGFADDLNTTYNALEAVMRRARNEFEYPTPQFEYDWEIAVKKPNGESQ